MELAQEVKSSLVSADEQEQYLRQIRSSRFSKHYPKRSNSSVSSYLFDDNEEQNVSKRLLQRRASSRHQNSKVIKSKPTNEKSEAEQTSNDENQDAGIWVIPLLLRPNSFKTTFFSVNSNSLLYFTNG